MKSGVNRRAPRHSCAIRWRSRKSVKRRCPPTRSGFFHARAISCVEISSVGNVGKRRKTAVSLIVRGLRPISTYNFLLLNMDGRIAPREIFSTRLEGQAREEESKGDIIRLPFLQACSILSFRTIEIRRRRRKGKKREGRNGIIELSVCQQVARHCFKRAFQTKLFPARLKALEKKKNRRVNF